MRRACAAVVAAVSVLVAGCAEDPAGRGVQASGPPVVDVVVTPFSLAGEATPPAQRYRLARDAQRLLDRLSGLGELPRSDGCNDDAGNTLDLTVRRPGAEPVQVRAQDFGCQPVTGWGEDRAGGREVRDLVFELLERQRIASPVADPVPGRCPTPLWEQLTIVRQPVPQWDALALLDRQAPGMPYEAVGARVCRYDGLGAASRPAVERVVAADVAERLRRLVSADLRVGAGYPCDLVAEAADVVVWVDASGGSFEARIARDDCAGIVTGGDLYAGGTAGADLLAALDAALG